MADVVCTMQDTSLLQSEEGKVDLGTDADRPVLAKLSADFEEALQQMARVHRLELMKLQEKLMRLRANTQGAISSPVYELAPAPRVCSEASFCEGCPNDPVPMEREKLPELQSNTSTLPSRPSDQLHLDLDKCDRQETHSENTGDAGTDPAVECFDSVVAQRVLGGRRRKSKLQENHDMERVKQHLKRRDTNNIIGDSWKIDLSEGASLSCMVRSPIFDSAAAIIIFFNSIVMGAETEWNTRNAEENPILEGMGTFCNVVFVMELIFRMLALKLQFFTGQDRVWNVFDVALVLQAIVDETMTRVTKSGTSGSVGALKMMKMMRIVRVFRVFRFFRQLSRLALMILDSIRSLFWAMFMLLLITYVFAVVLTTRASEWLIRQVDTTQPDWHSQLQAGARTSTIQRLYGSVPQTLYTLFRAAMAGISWGEVCDPLFEVGWFAVLMLLAYISFTVLAVLNVVTGVFVDNAFRSADKQRSDVIQKEIDKKEEYESQIHDFFVAIDGDRSGEITPAELALYLDDDTMAAFFRVLGFEIHDPMRFIDLLDADESGALNFNEFLEGCLKYRGPAQSIDVHTILRACQQMNDRISELQGNLNKILKVPDTE
eukprot:TRINITY_DN23886_c0_g3_i1.p1 TRINITY_DN23886_c0_g3~~TRINITY_DN23886_c0_g3_i1.p1  ORF type:complete len:602 (-),score=106.66 TRINITY_DN23886_c0_g3_i1:90-1895(-)